MRTTRAFWAVFIFSIVLILGVSWMVAAQDEGGDEGEAAQTAPLPTSVPTQAVNLPITSDFNYVIRPRDTLDGIGALFDVSIDCIREVNNLSRAEILQPGDTLLIDVDCPIYNGVQVVEFPRPDAPGRVIIDGTYVVQPNDTLDTIAQELDVSVQALEDANDIINPRSLSVGTVLTIPEDAPPYGVFPAQRRLGSGGTGGTGSEPQSPFRSPSQPIVITRNVDPNDPSDDAPPVGAQAAVRGSEYVVQPNDTLDTIGQQLDVSVVSLRMANNIDNPKALFPGDVLTIPADAPPYGVFPALTEADGTRPMLAAASAAPRTAGATAEAPVAGSTYVIQPGDTLDGIAQAANVSVAALRLENDIESARDIQPGTVIVIPADAPAYGLFPALEEAAGDVIADGEQYVIQPNDTLDGIAARFDVDTLCLIEANQIANVRAIRAGQVIGIPTGCPIYTGFDVVPGRTRTPPTLVPTTVPDSARNGGTGGTGSTGDLPPSEPPAATPTEEPAG